MEDKRFKVAKKEALIGIALVIINFIWWFGFGSEDPAEYKYIFGLPEWFFYSCVLGFIVMSIVITFTFIWPVVFGLYWSKGNKYGAISSMVIGMGSYILFDRLLPNAFGMHTVVLPIFLSLITFVVVSYFTDKSTLLKRGNQEGVV